VGVYKGLNRSSVFSTDYVSKKKWNVTAEEMKDLGIKVMRLISGSIPYYFSPLDELPYGPVSSSNQTGKYNARLAYESVNHNYYSGSLGDGICTGSVDLSLQTTLTVQDIRTLDSKRYRPLTKTGIVAFNYPRDSYYYTIEPESIKINPDEDIICYVEDDYVEEDYFEDLHIYSCWDKNSEILYRGFTGEWENLLGSEYPVPIHSESIHAGDAIYAQGLLVLTNPFLFYVYGSWDVESLEWRSNVPVFTYNVSLPVKDREFNYTWNKTAPIEIQTGSFVPYITTVGLYNGADELVAVAKLNKPIPKANNIDMTINVRIDLS